MKKLIYLFIFLFCLGFYGQNGPDQNVGTIDHTIWPATESSDPYVFSSKEEEIRDRALAENKVKNEKFTGLSNVSPGYYIIANVYKNPRYLTANLKKLRKKGFRTGSIFNENRGLNYLYLERFDRWEDALEACISNFNGTYTKDKWMMIVQPDTGNTVSDPIEEDEMPQEKIPLEEITYEMLTSIGIEEPAVDEGNLLHGNSWIWRAEEYFDKMWYAEAAELYEKALGRNPDNYDMGILQKAGDAHYFNTNMERAYFWYQKIYDRNGDGMNADYLFKYAHSLKGIGKYGRAKRIMRIYEKNKDGGITDKGHGIPKISNEMLMDEILTKEHNVTLKNLSINSKYSDFGPMFYNEDEIVYSSAKDSPRSNTKRYKWTNQPFLDLYVAKIAEGSQDLKETKRFPKVINTKYHEAVVSFTADKATMYFTRNNYDKRLKGDADERNNLKIYVSKNIDGEWSEAKELPFNSNKYSTGHPALSPDGKKLYFISDMPGSIGETDIFVVDILGDGHYSQPKNLGPGINTDRKEMFPFVTDKKLYFSSNGRVGLGGLDVYEALLDEEGGFKEVMNLGLPINSERDDFSYIVNEKTNKGYFASNRKGGQGDDDLYSFERQTPEEKVHNSIVGTVRELITGDFMPHASVSLMDGNSIKLIEMVTAEDGSFVFGNLEPETQYTVKVTKDGFFENIVSVRTKENEIVPVDVPMKKLEELIVLEDGVKKLKTDMIYFDFDSSHIRKDASYELDKLVEVMRKYEDMVIKIEAHTDSRGVAVYNQYLSDKRAKSTRDYIISKGISKDRIESAIGYGEARLINECKDGVPCSRQNHERNRRSEFIIVKM